MAEKVTLWLVLAGLGEALAEIVKLAGLFVHAPFEQLVLPVQLDWNWLVSTGVQLELAVPGLLQI